MLLNLWRSGLRSWLASKLLVDSWELRNPTVYGTLNAFIPPLRMIEFPNNDDRIALAIQDFYITSRYRGDAAYDTLPLGILEQLHANIQYRLSLEYGSIAPLVSLEVSKVENPVQVMEYGDGLADWLVTLEFSFGITWVFTPTPLPGDTVLPIPNITSVTTGLYTEHLASPSHTDPTQRDKVGDLITRQP